MKFIILFILTTLSNVYGVSISPNLYQVSDFGMVKNYRDPQHSVDVSRMPSDFTFKDLIPENVKSLDKVHDVKREYGKMFGFREWQIVDQKLLIEDSERILLFEGNYKNEKGDLVSFLEVYWADQKGAQQFLITSEKKSLKMDAYQEFLVK